MDDHDATQGKPALTIACFLVITACTSSIFWALIISAGHVGAANGLYVTALMWCPAMAAIATVLIRRLKFRDLALRWGGWRYALLGYVTPLAYSTIAYALVWTLGFGFFPDLAGLAEAAKNFGWTVTSPIAFFFMVGTVMIVPSLLTALGEEIGWRGLLTPLLVKRFGFSRGSLLIGVIWAAWHFPILLFADYNSGTPWWFSIPCFCVLTIGLSVILGWFRLASNSVWPCALLHATHNALVQGFFTPLTGRRGTLTAYMIDEFGIALPLIIALFAVGFWLQRDRALRRFPGRLLTPAAPA